MSYVQYDSTIHNHRCETLSHYLEIMHTDTREVKKEMCLSMKTILLFVACLPTEFIWNLFEGGISPVPRPLSAQDNTNTGATRTIIRPRA
jgi:hypothetical protein